MRFFCGSATVACACAALFGICATGCNSPHDRMNAPPHGTTEKVSDMQGTFVYMGDNALLADMSVTDTHFMPHRAMLTTAGELRVTRLAELMNAYGGTIRLASNLSDPELLSKRKDAVVSYLGELGVDTTTEVVGLGLQGGRGMEAAEAVLIKKSEGTYSPEKANDDKGASATPKTN